MFPQSKGKVGKAGVGWAMASSCDSNLSQGGEASLEMMWVKVGSNSFLSSRNSPRCPGKFRPAAPSLSNLRFDDNLHVY